MAYRCGMTRKFAATRSCGIWRMSAASFTHRTDSNEAQVCCQGITLFEGYCGSERAQVNDMVRLLGKHVEICCLVTAMQQPNSKSTQHTEPSRLMRRSAAV